MTFIGPDFLLQNPTAQTLYHEVVENLPIIDYHNHLIPEQLAGNHKFENISQAWLSGDHYKWRAMRALGIDENFITGSASDVQKFEKWAEAVPYTLRNPLYHWTHLELKRYFGVDDLLNSNNATEIYSATTAQLQLPENFALGLLDKMQVEVVCTTDDPADSLEHHRALAQTGAKLKMYPTFRPDLALNTSNPEAYNTYLDRLEMASGKSINSYSDLLDVLADRVAFFHTHGCRLSDHGMEQLYYFESPLANPEVLFKAIRAGQSLNREQQDFFTFETLTFLCKKYHEFGWVQQFHLGALRNTNSRMLSVLGKDTGFDSIGDFPQAKPLAGFLNLLDSSNQLTKTILYNLNPAWNEVFASLIGNFNDGSVAGKIQFGSGWWFNDQLDGMEKQINALSNMGLLSRFVGMLTDSRSLLSFPRHEYFRRLLCQIIGSDVKKGLLPNDHQLLSSMLKDICYYNARSYFDFPVYQESKNNSK